MPSFAETMVTKLETLLASSAGLRSVNVAGESVTYDELERRYDYWKSRVARESGTRPIASTVDLSGGV